MVLCLGVIEGMLESLQALYKYLLNEYKKICRQWLTTELCVDTRAKCSKCLASLQGVEVFRTAVGVQGSIHPQQ